MNKTRNSPINNRRFSSSWKQLVCKSPNRLQSHLFQRVAYQEVPFAMLCYVADPVAVAISRRTMQLFLLFVATVQIITIAKSKSTNILSKRFMFRPFQIRGHGLVFERPDHANTAKIEEFGLMHHGVEIQLASNLTFISDGSVLLEFADGMDWDGWFLITSRVEPPHLDPVRFALYAYDGSNWTLVGSSTYFCLHTSTFFLHGRFDTPLLRGARVAFDLTRRRFGLLTYVAVSAIAGAAAGALQREHYGVLVLFSLYPGVMITFLARAACWAAARQWVGCAVYLYFVAFHWVNYLHVRHECWCQGFIFFGMHSVAVSGILYNFSGPNAASRYMLVQGVIVAALGGGVKVSAWLTRRWSQRVVLHHQVAYDVAWRHLSAAAAPDLAALDAAVRRLFPTCPSGEQGNAEEAAGGVKDRLPRQSMVGGGGRDSKAVDASALRAIYQDLAVLYDQATAAEPLFRSRVWAYAVRSRGSFVAAPRRQLASSIGPWSTSFLSGGRSIDFSRTTSESRPVESSRRHGGAGAGRWMRRSASEVWAEMGPCPKPPPSPSQGLAETGSWWGLSWLMPAELGEASYVQASEVGMWRVRWAGLKGLQRAVEKAMRCYRGDASRLCDLVRQAIIFDEVSDLIACLEAVAQDPDISIVRIKNRYHPCYDAGESAGYRDVNLSLRLEGKVARSCGAAGHICELQLVLKSFHSLRTAEGHQGYVAFRNALAR